MMACAHLFVAVTALAATPILADQCKKASYAFCCEVGTPCDCTKGVTTPGQCKPESYGFCCSIGTPCDCSQPPAPEVNSSSPARDTKVDMEDSTEFERIAAIVNAAKAGWTADPAASGRFTSLSHVKMLLGTFQKGHPSWKNVSLPDYSVVASASTSLDAVPAAFDPRSQWPKCTIIAKVRNQAGCGSCWAFGATESFEGSRCIATGDDIEFSADDTAACGGGIFSGNGCNGGQPSSANEWFVRTGVVTGGEYGTKDGCLPYVCPPCTKGLYPPDCPTSQCIPLLKCTKKCSNGDYPKTYSADKTKASSSFSVSSLAKMQQALSTTGPLAVAFSVYADFPTYTSGVYSHTTGDFLGGHAVVMLGWGTENGKAYWVIKNSWSEKWGDKGFFKIARGVDECGIEDDVSGTLHSKASVVV